MVKKQKHPSYWSSGIGKKTAEMLVEKGAKVLITGRS